MYKKRKVIFPSKSILVIAHMRYAEAHTAPTTKIAERLQFRKRTKQSLKNNRW